MTDYSTDQVEFAPLKGKKVVGRFDEPRVTSDAGVMFVREVDLRLGLTERLVKAIFDKRRQSHVSHEMVEMVSQREYQIVCGYEDGDDWDHLRGDPAFKAAVGRDPRDDPDMASQPTMSRLENAVRVRDLLRMGYAFVDNFIESYPAPPQCIVLDMDPTTDAVHGHQQLALFNAYEDEYCFMPFHVYEGISGKLITTVLRSGKTPTAPEIISVLKRIVRRVRGAWPETLLVFRADSHHTKPEVMDWIEERGLAFTTGLSKNARLHEIFRATIARAEATFKRTGRPVREYGSAFYAAGTSSKMRRVICRVLVTDQGADVRYIVTSFERAGAKYRYETVYCGRGKMEHKIKDHNVGLKSDRTTCTSKEANGFRLFLHSAAYLLMHAVRECLLKGTELAKAQFDTIRLRLFKIGARVEVLKTLIRFHLPESYPLKAVLGRASSILRCANTS